MKEKKCVNEENLEEEKEKAHELMIYQAHELFKIRVEKLTTTHGYILL